MESVINPYNAALAAGYTAMAVYLVHRTCDETAIASLIVHRKANPANPTLTCERKFFSIMISLLCFVLHRPSIFCRLHCDFEIRYLTCF